LKKIITILGARPQFIKAAAISRLLRKRVNEIIIHTGQHYDWNMTDIFFEEMNIPKPDYFLNINKLFHGAMTGRMMEGIETILLKELPDAVLVYGDTNSTLAGALVAKKLKIKVIHVESGMRSFNMNMPEEINRILVDKISDLLFYTSNNSILNLLRENNKGEFVNSGDVMYDSIIDNLEFIKNSNYVLCTIHREENTNKENLTILISALNKIHKESPVVFPMHPRTKQCIDKYKIQVNFPLIDPVGYKEMNKLLKNCRLVITDSGGLQKESYYFNKYCLILRNETEWVELIELGCGILAGNDDEKRIIKAFNKIKNKVFDFRTNIYGNGKASQIISDNIIKYLK